MTTKGKYPAGELCLAQRKDEPGPCQTARNSCTAHCNAKRSDGGRCARRPDGPSLRCGRHGGKSPKGRAHPRYKDGGHSKYTLPPGILERYQLHIEDPELTHHRSLVAMYDALLDNIFEEWDKSPSLEEWKALKVAVDKLTRAMDSGDTVGLLEAISDIEAYVEQGISKAAKRKELVRIGEARRKAAAAESKRKFLESKVYTPEQVALFSEQVGLVVQKYLPEELYIDFYNDFARLIGSREIKLDDDGGDFSDEAPD